MIKTLLSLLSGLILSGSALFIPAYPLAAQERAIAELSPTLRLELAQSNAPISFLVILDQQADPADAFADSVRRSASLEERRIALYAYLTAFARRHQQPLWSWLDARGVAYRPFYIVNAIEVSGDAELVDALRRRPEVARLAANPAVELERPVARRDSAPWLPSEYLGSAALPETPDGIRYANAPQVWAMGYRGQDVVIASQDTGVYWEHPALKSKYRGWDAESESVEHAYNWYDPWGVDGRPVNCDRSDAQVPCDDNGHGTHTVGTLVGSDAQAPGGARTVGMAPDAQWIGCRNMRRGVGSPASYTACFEFFLAPFPQDGDPFLDGDPTQAPDIINNSWYCPPEEGCDFDSLQQVVGVVREAGIMIVASAGNNGSSCSSVRYPISGYGEVFSVGAHDALGRIALFSSRGPVTVDGSNRLKPQIAAPGVDVLSTADDGTYEYLSGTSMASPHAAGAVALLWSAVPALKGDIDATAEILMQSAVGVENNDCGEGPEPVVPNYTYGYGRLDALAAVRMAQQGKEIKHYLLWIAQP